MTGRPETIRRAGELASVSRCARPQARAAPHPPRCSYVLVVTVAPCLVLEPGSAARARAAAAALPGHHRGRLGSQGLGPRTVVLGSLAAQEMARLWGRREGPRGVDLAREPLVQRSHGSPRALSLAVCWAVRCSAFSLPVPSPHPLQGKSGADEQGGKRAAAGHCSSVRHS